MKPSKQLNFVICLVSSTIIFSSGCHSGFLKKPDFGKLAFWKKDELRLASRRDDIPPPSAHFSPDQGTMAKSDPKSELKASIDEIIAEAKKNREKPVDAIRKPYSLDSIDPKIGLENATANTTKTDESTSLKSSNTKDFVLSEKLNKIQSATNRAFTATDDTIKQTEAIVENTSNSFTGWKNNLQSAGDAEVKNVSEQLKDQANQVMASTTESVNDFANSTGESFNQAVSTVKNSLDNSFSATAAPQFVANPFSQAGAPDGSNDSMNEDVKNSNTVTNEFVSKYKTAAQYSPNKLTPGNSFTSNPTQPDMSEAATVKQSSYDDAIKKNTAAILQPIESKTASQPPATKYPATSFGAIRPIQSTKPDDSLDAMKIPPQLLRGNNSFAPGSTKSLRPENSGK